MRRSLVTIAILALLQPAAAQQLDTARYARLLQMADERRLDSALVKEMLAKGAPAERAAAARAVGQVHGTAMAPSLRALLTDADSAVAANAAFALGLLKDSASVSALAGALNAPPTVAAQAAWSLGAIGAPAASALRMALMARIARPPAVTAALVVATSKLRPLSAAPALPWLGSTDVQVRWAAVYAIARPYAAGGVRAVLPLARDPDAEIRALVARALSHQAAGDSLAALARPALDSLARDPAEHVRVNAVRALSTYGLPARAAVLAALRDADANVRLTAAQSLGPVLAGVQGRKPWIDAWAADTTFTFRRAVLISALGNDVVLEAADADNPEGWRHQSDWRYRAAVAEAGGASKNVERVREISLPLARDPDPRVRVAAYSALAPYVDSAEGHAWRREFVYFALTDYDPVVRSVAIGILESRATAAEAALVVRGYARSAADTLNDARLATIGLLKAAWQNDSAQFTDSLRAAIRAMPAPPDQASRDAAREVALLVAWTKAPPLPPRHAVVYDLVVRTLVLPALNGKHLKAEIRTARGNITIEFAPVDAPLTVYNFLALIRGGWYDGLRWHRVVPNFVAQDGDRRGDGSGGPGPTIRDELNRLDYDRGVFGMALSGPDTGGSQYFITLSAQPHLDAGYTAFGRVVSGWDALDATVQGDAILSVHILE